MSSPDSAVGAMHLPEAAWGRFGRSACRMPKKIIAQRSGLVLYRNIAEQFPGQRDVRMRMPDVAGPKVPVHGFRSRGQTSLCNEHRGYVRVEVVKGPGRPAAHVINAVE